MDKYNKSVQHQWFHHATWGSPKYKNEGVGKVLWHSLTEDGKVEIVKIKFGNKIYDNVNVKHLNPIDEGSHSHPKRKKNADKKKKQESKMSLKLEELVGKPITEAQFDEAAGKKDACYHKVKARYDVWPSAYASGALVKCRKVGAANWGNKSKKESVNILGVKKLNEGKFRVFFDLDGGTPQTNLGRMSVEVTAKDKKEAEKMVASKFVGGMKLIKKGSTKKLKESVNKQDVFFESTTKDGMTETHIYWESDGKPHGYTFNFVNELNEAEYQGRKVKLGKIMQGDTKKFKVYVKNPKGNVVKVNFGQGGKAKGGTMRIRKSNPKARANFRARHNCDNPGPRHKARYWSCRKW